MPPILASLGSATLSTYGFRRSTISQAIDAYFNLTTLLLPGNGTNGAQNNTFLDNSDNNFTVTRGGNTTQGTFTPFSQTGWGNYFDGSGDFLSVADNAAFQLGSGDFTLEFWVYFPAGWGAGNSWLMGKGDATSATGSAFSFFRTSFEFYSGGNTYTLTPPAWAASTWYHCAVVRSGTGSDNLKLYINGAVQSQASISTNSVNTGGANPLKIGEYASDSPESYISNFRIVKGTAVYTAAFTPPTAPLTAISGTSILTCQSNRFVDNGTANSGSGFSITGSGTPSIQAFSPLQPNVAYSASTVGGSGYFDGTGDYLALSGSPILTTGDFSVELLVYNTVAVDKTLCFFRGTSTGGYAGLRVGISASHVPYLLMSTNGSTWTINANAGTYTAPLNAWTYIVITRNGGTITLYVNGVAAITSTAISGATALFSGTLNYVGAINNSGISAVMNGYLSSVRVSNNVRTVVFPTAPYTSDGNTTLLLNFTNAGITDATAKNDLETLSNAQISTARSPFGGSSMLFNGSTDALNFPVPKSFYFRTGDFTIEFWANYTSTGAGVVFLGNFNNNTNANGVWTVYHYGNTNLLSFFCNTGVVYQSSWTPVVDTWYHIAVCRSGTSLRMFVNGTQVGITHTSNDDIGDIYQQSGGWYVARSNDSAAYFPGYLSNIRVTTGFARYVANFTPPGALPLQ